MNQHIKLTPKVFIMWKDLPEWIACWQTPSVTAEWKRSHTQWKARQARGKCEASLFAWKNVSVSSRACMRVCESVCVTVRRTSELSPSCLANQQQNLQTLKIWPRWLTVVFIEMMWWFTPNLLIYESAFVSAGLGCFFFFLSLCLCLRKGENNKCFHTQVGEKRR